MWSFENGIEVYDRGDYFTVYNGDKLLGYVQPGTPEDKQLCIEDLDAGKDPITAGWEDGNGNSCSIYGWGEFYDEDSAL